MFFFFALGAPALVKFVPGFVRGLQLPCLLTFFGFWAPGFIFIFSFAFSVFFAFRLGLLGFRTLVFRVFRALGFFGFGFKDEIQARQA